MYPSAKFAFSTLTLWASWKHAFLGVLEWIASIAKIFGKHSKFSTRILGLLVMVRAQPSYF